MAVPMLALLQMRLGKLGKQAVFGRKGLIIVYNNHHAVLLQGLGATFAMELVSLDDINRIEVL
jgi:hypothetical protein